MSYNLPSFGGPTNINIPDFLKGIWDKASELIKIPEVKAEGYTLTVVTKDTKGNPINSAVVSVSGQTKTGSQVTFNLPAGNYSVSVSADGYESRSDTVKVPDTSVQIFQLRSLQEKLAQESAYQKVLQNQPVYTTQILTPTPTPLPQHTVADLRKIYVDFKNKSSVLVNQINDIGRWLSNYYIKLTDDEKSYLNNIFPNAFGNYALPYSDALHVVEHNYGFPNQAFVDETKVYVPDNVYDDFQKYVNDTLNNLNNILAKLQTIKANVEQRIKPAQDVINSLPKGSPLNKDQTDKLAQAVKDLNTPTESPLNKALNIYKSANLNPISTSAAPQTTITVSTPQPSTKPFNITPDIAIGGLVALVGLGLALFGGGKKQ